MEGTERTVKSGNPHRADPRDLLMEGRVQRGCCWSVLSFPGSMVTTLCLLIFKTVKSSDVPHAQKLLYFGLSLLDSSKMNQDLLYHSLSFLWALKYAILLSQTHHIVDLFITTPVTNIWAHIGK